MFHGIHEGRAQAAINIRHGLSLCSSYKSLWPHKAAFLAPGKHWVHLFALYMSMVLLGEPVHFSSQPPLLHQPVKCTLRRGLKSCA